jgi:hypothetical protein
MQARADVAIRRRAWIDRLTKLGTAAVRAFAALAGFDLHERPKRPGPAWGNDVVEDAPAVEDRREPSALAQVGAYGFLVLVLVGAYAGWVLLTAWAALRIVDGGHVSTSAWLATTSLAFVAGVVGMYTIGRRWDRATGYVLILGPVVVEVLAFAALRST